MSITRSVAAIPPEKRKPKILKTLAGAVIFVGAFYLVRLGFPWQASLAVAAFGGFIASQEMVVAFAKVVPATIAAVVRALSGKNGE